MHTTDSGYMQMVSGASGEKRGNRRDEQSCMLSCLKGLMHSKYGDAILLGGVTIAFGLLLMASAIG
jgi:hypothetical protein